ncbi:hypothetical protein JNB85_05770 [Rhizobium mesosinicum]|uniref:Uncharacterized protein n=1 Tax=Rhizobium mesosinicum TaxID=335017 RepID=A0ABS7GPN6_9HYPH|nr:hypothetical protein [Rhizobium mesosinicum]
MILTDNWEEECCQSDEGALGGGVRCLRDYQYSIHSLENSEITAMQQCMWRNACLPGATRAPHFAASLIN